LVLIDIAVPRDIDPDVQAVDNVYLYNIDHLEAIVRENLKSREKEVGRCDEIINGRATQLMTKLNPPPVRPPAFSARPGFNIFQPATCSS
jgi:glutamyl-tRNA reductase